MGLSSFSGKGKRREYIVAVDIGGKRTKAIHLQRRADSFLLTNYVIIDSPSPDKPCGIAEFSELFKQLSQSLGQTRTKQLTIAVGVHDTVFKQVELPSMAADEMRQMLRYNCKTYLQQELTDHVFDCFYLPLREVPKPAEGSKTPALPTKQKAAVGGARRQLLDDLMAAAKATGWIADQVVPALIGPINAFELSEPEVFSKEVIGLVDVGFRSTVISILDQGELVLNRVVAIGGDRLTSGLADSMGISYAEAEGIKIGMPSEVQPNLEALINPLGRELRASLDFVEHQFDRPVSQVFLSGGSARNEYILQALQAELMVSCRTWNPTRCLQVNLPPQRVTDLEGLTPELTVAVGAAITAF